MRRDKYPQPKYLAPRLLAAALLGMGIGSFSLSGHALGLGPAQVRSGIGQPLRVKVPVLADSSEMAGGEECFRLVQGPHQGGADLPTLRRAVVKLVQGAQGKYLLLTTAYPVNDPVLDFSLESVCDNSLRRDYTVLIDVVPNLAEESSFAPVTAAASIAKQPVVREGSNAAVMPSSRREHKDVAARHRSSRLLSVNNTAKQAEKTISAAPRKAVPISAGHAPASSGDHFALHISTSLSAWPGQRGQISDASQTAQPLDNGARLVQADALQDDMVALQKQLAETRATVAILRKQIAAMTAAPMPAALPSGSLKQDSASWPAWYMYLVGALTAGAAGLYLLRRQRRSNPPVVTDVLPDAVAVNITDPWTEAFWEKPEARQPISGDIDGQAQPGVDTPRRATTERFASQSGRKEDDFLVSTVNQITEEAAVFVHLGYPERAMTLLTEHIASHERSHPAVWYLLFDLYRDNGQRAEFELAQMRFRGRFNLVAPQWQNSPESEADSVGILSFPHVLECTARLWPTSACRTYLEGLLYDNRGGERMGFSHQTYQDLVFLIGLLEHELELVQAPGAQEAQPESAAPEGRLRLIQGGSA
ncbi:hypothetical protein SFMTTN_1183 [Sulfuriferula multivorans]|uniref:FimV N-terminal domain-containing protein n=1 Tax=Sulfuriferula multivorans TaxID=1559896 RepID=A0A401JCT8_9PROT|nr:hypothetical protein [Sulfuriferula multivorans]GBL45376.1 hypothetical protein SFMTTN_1183 [Sulfuriferula multivorans]